MLHVVIIWLFRQSVSLAFKTFPACLTFFFINFARRFTYRQLFYYICQTYSLLLGSHETFLQLFFFFCIRCFYLVEVCFDLNWVCCTLFLWLLFTPFFACKEKFKRKRKNLIFHGFGLVFPDVPKFGQKSRMDCLVGCLVDIRMNKSL